MTAKRTRYAATKTNWTTADELAWMQRAGEWGEKGVEVEPWELLARYRKTLDERCKWGLLDRVVVKAACEKMLKSLGEGN